MHREIKFRGMTLDGSGFVYGYFMSWSHFNGKGYEDVFAIETPNKGKQLVDPKTVGQFKGLIDKNGKDIYEGDICNLTASGYSFDVNRQIFFKDGQFLFDTMSLSSISSKDGTRITVIGNIHENPELLCS